MWISHGQGSRVVDLDGTSYVDLHGGFGVNLVGHAHPAVVRTIDERVRKGTHFAQPTQDAVVVARLLAERFGLPMWRFGNSGTEATMDAVHLMRAATGRMKILKVEGSYHGHHDSVQVSVYPVHRGGRAAAAAALGALQPVRAAGPRPADRRGAVRRSGGRRAGADRELRRGRRR